MVALGVVLIYRLDGDLDDAALPALYRRAYEAVQRGVLAVLPHCDDFVAGHSLATYAKVLEVVARA